MRPFTFDLQRMIELRLEGWGYAALGREFKKDHTTIMYHCRRLGLAPDKPKRAAGEDYYHRVDEGIYETELPRTAHKYDHLLYEKMNKGKTYAEYLAEALKRPVEKKYHKTYHENTSLSGIFTGLARIKEEEGTGDNAENPGVDEGELQW